MIVLMRHGQGVLETSFRSKWSDGAARRYDPPLTAIGRRQVERQAQRIAGMCRDSENKITIYLSPMLRCLQSLEHLAAGLRVAYSVPVEIKAHIIPELASHSKAARRKGLNSLEFVPAALHPEHLTSIVPSPAPNGVEGLSFNSVLEEIRNHHCGRREKSGEIVIVLADRHALKSLGVLRPGPCTFVTLSVDSLTPTRVRLDIDDDPRSFERYLSVKDHLNLSTVSAATHQTPETPEVVEEVPNNKSPRALDWLASVGFSTVGMRDTFAGNDRKIRDNARQASGSFTPPAVSTSEAPGTGQQRLGRWVHSSNQLRFTRHIASGDRPAVIRTAASIFSHRRARSEGDCLDAGGISAPSIDSVRSMVPAWLRESSYCAFEVRINSASD